MGSTGFIHAIEFDGKGGGRLLQERQVRASVKQEGVTWLHLDRTAPDAQRWIREEAGLDSVACNALLAAETRPRCVAFAEGLLVILRGINLNPGQDPEDMISLRIWVDEKRVLTLRSTPMLAASDVLMSLEKGAGPRNAGDFLLHIVERLSDRMDPVIDDLDEQIEMIYEHKEKDWEVLRENLSTLRRQIVTLRRHIAPQREVLAALQLESFPWLTKQHKIHLREAGDRLHRFVEDLDATRAHSAIAQDDLASHFSDRLNRKMYLLAILTGIFLPLGFFTGLLGVNFGGIPGGSHPYGFLTFCGILATVVALQIYIFKKIKLL